MKSLGKLFTLEHSEIISSFGQTKFPPRIEDTVMQDQKGAHFHMNYFVIV